MGHRGLPTTAELLTVMRHLADVASLKGNPTAQRQLLVDGLGHLFETTLGWVYGLDDARPGRPLKPFMGVLAGNLDPTWVRYLADFAVHVAPTDDMYADHLINSDAAEQQWTRARVLPDKAAWRRYGPVADVMLRSGIGDGAVCGFRTGPGGDRMVGFSLHRCRSDPPMRARDYALHRFAIGEIRRLVDRGHLSITPPPSTGLSPRLQQVLERLLAGHAPKRIAHEIGLSVWTVRDHIKRIYAELGVSGRDELMARFIRRA